VMINMVAKINKDNFGGQPRVTCWTCHHNRDRPADTANFETIYGEAQLIPDVVVTQAQGVPSATQILDKFIEASGGAAKLANLKSIDAHGTQAGFGGFGGGGAAEIAGQFPDKKSTIILFRAETGRGDQIRSYDGKDGWVRTPLNVIGEYQLEGGDLDGARFDAQLMFPQQIKSIMTNLKSGNQTTITSLPVSESQAAVQKGANVQTTTRVNVVQGTGPRGLLVTLYFDEKTGLLARELRYSQTSIGRVPVQVDFGDYRDVDGVKLPFYMAYVWLDGRDSIVLNDVKTNVQIDPAKFGRPPAQKKK
jgi:photosynthetic reaction center cytochrome c subunit